MGLPRSYTSDSGRQAKAIFNGIVREVYQITTWLEGGSTFNTRYDRQGAERQDRWEFVGVVAKDSVRDRYLNGFVGHYFTPGAQNPISYVNLDT